jgi:hypothetical protein
MSGGQERALRDSERCLDDDGIPGVSDADAGDARTPSWTGSRTAAMATEPADVSRTATWPP